MNASAIAQPAPTHPCAARHPSSTGWHVLHSVRNLDMDAPAARPLALVVGATLGGLVGLVANAIAPVPALVLGALLGETSLLLSRGERWDRAQHPHRVSLLQAYPALRELCDQYGVRMDDRARVRTIHDELQRRLDEKVQRYRQHCQLRNLPQSEILDNVIKAFYLSHCTHQAGCIITCLEEGSRYMVAVGSAAPADLDQAINVEGRAPRDVLREMGLPFVRLDLLGNALREASSFRVTCAAGEWTVAPSATLDPVPLVDCYLPSAEPVVRVQRIARSGRASPVATPTRRSNEGAEPGATQRPCRTVVISAGFSRELDQLPPHSPTLQKLKELIDDLEHGRLQGHMVKLRGQACYASDASVEGDRDRGRWRVLYKRNEAGYELLGIYDYHASPHPVRWSP